MEEGQVDLGVSVGTLSWSAGRQTPGPAAPMGQANTDLDFDNINKNCLENLR